MAQVEVAPYNVLGSMVDNQPEPLLEPENGDVDPSRNFPKECGEGVSDMEQEEVLEEPTPKEESTPQEEPREEEECENVVSQLSMELNCAFEALEGMRKANLEVEFGGKAIPNVNLLHNYCTTCLYVNKEREDEKMKRLSENEAYMSNPNRERRRMLAKRVMTRLRTKRRSPPCLICTSPVCKLHRCPEFRKEKIIVCCKCSKLFTMDFVVATMASSTDQEQRRRSIAHMVDSYDRALLILRYSAQFIDRIAEALEYRSKTSDQIGLGSSGVGLTSGLTGVAAVTAKFVAAAAILSPAGPPLVVASILFGASAAAASGGTEAVNYYSEPNQLACKIIALYDLVHSLVGVSKVLKSALAQGLVDPTHFTDMKPDKKISTYWKSRAPEVSSSAVETVTEEEEEESDKEMVEEPKAKEEKTPSEDGPHSEYSTEEAGTSVEQTEKSDVVKPEITPTYYSLSEIDDDCDDKKDAEISVTESCSTESENEPEKNLDKATELDQTLTTAVPVTSATSQEVLTKPEPTKRAYFASLARRSRVSEGAATTLLMSTVARREGFPQSQDQPTSSTEVKSRSGEIVKHVPSLQRAALTRTLTNSMKIAAFASIACCMLSAATIIMETKNLKNTLENMRRGSPCEKAAQLRKIKREIENLPDTSEIAEGWEAYAQEAEKQESKSG